MLTAFSPSPSSVNGHLNTVSWAAPPPVYRSKRCAKPLAVPGITRDIQVKIASEAEEWEQALQLVRKNYLASGYESPSPKLVRFTPYHALPDTKVFVAKHEGEVVATVTLVPDNTLLGMPLEELYAEEIKKEREAGRFLGEVTSLAMSDLSQREFLQVFTLLIRMLIQHHTSHGGDTCAITVNPRHRNFYGKLMGFVPLGPCRAYDAVEGAPAEAYMVDEAVMRVNAPNMAQKMFDVRLPEESLTADRLPERALLHLAEQSSQIDKQTVEDLLESVRLLGSPRRW